MGSLLLQSASTLWILGRTTRETASFRLNSPLSSGQLADGEIVTDKFHGNRQFRRVFPCQWVCRTVSIFLRSSLRQDGKDLFVSDDIRVGWDPIWVQVDAILECDANEAFKGLKDCMFAIFNGNHRLYSWSLVTRSYPNAIKYHPRVMCQTFDGEKGELHRDRVCNAINR